jgi:membrane protease YdiL (CAAX protease family)
MGFVAWVAAPAPAEATQRRSRITTQRAYLEVAAVYLLGFGYPVVSAFILLAHPGDVSTHVPTLHGQLIGVGVTWALQLPGLVLALWLARRRGWTLRRLGIRPTWVAADTQRGQAVRIICVMFAAQFFAAFMLSQVARGAHFPHGATGPWGLVGGVSGAIRSGISEELVVTAFIIVTLRQARRPWREILLVSLALRVAYHVYYGTPWIVLWIAIWAGAAFWLYWRTRRLTPIIVAHVLWDALGFTAIELGHVGETIVGAIYATAFFVGFLALVVATFKAMARAQAQASVP